MTREDRKASLKKFQSDASKTHTTRGYGADMTDILLGTIINSKNIVEAMQLNDTILFHKYLGIGAWYIANYCNINNLNLEEILDDEYSNFEYNTEDYCLEDYLQKIKDDISFLSEMNVEDRKSFVQKCFIATFPEEYYNDFIKIDRILKNNIEDSKIKFPEKFIN